MIYDSDLWIKDIDQIVDSLPELKELEDCSVLITGASGLICSSVADILIRYNCLHEKRIKIYLAGRSEKRMRERFGTFIDGDYICFTPYDATSEHLSIPEGIDYIIHGASNAYPRAIVENPVETMVSNFTGLLRLLEYARKNNTKRVLYISSSEVYGQNGNSQPTKETEYGYIDLLNPRNSYSVGKQAAETLCVSFHEEYGVDSVIVRPGHIYGPTASLDDNRVSSAWAYSVAHGDDIIMKSDGAQIRSYCYCLDCASAILTALINGKCGCAYNISNPNSVISIKQMAEIFARNAGVKLLFELPSEEERKGFNPMNNSSLDSTMLQELGWQGQFDAETGFAHTILIIRDMNMQKARV